MRDRPGAAALAPGFAVFALALCVVGLTSAVAQIIVPMSSSLAAERERGKVVGTVMSGLLIGILTARTASGIIAGLLGWRSVYLIGAAGMGCFSVLWTSIAFLLSGPPYDYSNAVIGLFGLAGLAGALIAPVTGRLADRGHGKLATSATIVVLLVSWGC